MIAKVCSLSRGFSLSHATLFHYIALYCIKSGADHVNDPPGVLARSIFTLRARLQPESVEDEYCSSESEIDYPLTPPLSDDAGSRPSSRQSDVHEIPPKLHVTTLQLLRTDNWTELSRRRSGSKSLSRRHSHRTSYIALVLHRSVADSGT